jgi:hypothetical protein
MSVCLFVYFQITLIAEWEKELKSVEHKRKLLKIVGKKQGHVCCRTCNKKLGELAWLKRRKTVYFIDEPEFFKINECNTNSTFVSRMEILAMGKS